MSKVNALWMDQDMDKDRLIETLVAALKRSEGELIYAAAKLPHSNAKDALTVVRRAIAEATP